MGNQQLLAGLICSDANLVERFVSIIGAVQRFRLRALWCPDTEKSIQLAATFDIPSVAHTAYQLICRPDTNTVIVTGHPGHNIIYCLQAQALKKEVICIGCLALSLRSAEILSQFSERLALPMVNIVYPLKYSKPLCLLRLNAEKLGILHSIAVEFCFKLLTEDRDRLLYDASTLLHLYGHELIDAIASICKTTPQRHAITYRSTTSVVQHFRLNELASAHMQIEFGNVVANFRLASADSDFLAIHIQGTNGILDFDLNSLKLMCDNQRLILWQGNGLFESIFRDGLFNALSTLTSIDHLDELSLVRCIGE